MSKQVMTREQQIMQRVWNAVSSEIYNADYALSNCYHGTKDEHDQHINKLREFVKSLDNITGRWPEFNQLVHKEG